MNKFNSLSCSYLASAPAPRFLLAEVSHLADAPRYAGAGSVCCITRGCRSAEQTITSLCLLTVPLLHSPGCSCPLLLPGHTGCSCCSCYSCSSPRAPAQHSGAPGPSSGDLVPLLLMPSTSSMRSSFFTLKGAWKQLAGWAPSQGHTAPSSVLLPLLCHSEHRPGSSARSPTPVSLEGSPVADLSS